MKEKETARETVVHTTSPGNCGGRCLLHVHLRDGQITKLTTEPPDPSACRAPLTACPRGIHYRSTFLNKDRLLYPMIRVGERGEGRFRRASWDEALDYIAREWVRIRETYGVGARYLCGGAGVCGALDGMALGERLLALDGGYLGYYNSYSSACVRHATALMYGTEATGSHLSFWTESRLIILWGHNPAETRFDSETMFYLRRAKEAGAAIVVVDPRRSDTVEALGARWIPIRPATDAAMMDAMAWVICSEGLQDQDFLDRCCLGFDGDHMPAGVPAAESYRAWLMGEKDGIEKTPAWAETVTGVPAETIRNLSLELSRAKPAALVLGWGPQRNGHGEQVVRGGITLACMTGNVGIPGGWASGVGDYQPHSYPQVPVPPNPYPYKIPCFRWTDGVERGQTLTLRDGLRHQDGSYALPGEHPETPVKLLLSMGGNRLINQHGDINRTADLLRDPGRCELIVVSDIFMTASAKFADVLLPGVSMFEMENITGPWAYGDFIGCVNPVMEPLGECRSDYDFLAALAERLGIGQQFTEGLTASGWLERLYNETREKEPELPDYREFRRAGIYRYRNHPRTVAFREEVRDPEHHPFPTPSGKIEIFSREIYDHPERFREPFPAIPGYLPPPEGPGDPRSERYPLQLVGYHSKRMSHSLGARNPELMRLDPQALWMNPADAEARGLADGEEVLVYNDRGRVRLPLRVTDRVRPGVTAMAQGAWYDPDGERVDRGGNINTLTSLRPTLYAHGNTQHTNLVEVRSI